MDGEPPPHRAIYKDSTFTCKFGGAHRPVRTRLQYIPSSYLPNKTYRPDFIYSKLILYMHHLDKHTPYKPVVLSSTVGIKSLFLNSIKSLQ